MIRFAVGEVVEAGVCPRRFALRRSGASVSRPQGTPVGAIVHRCVSIFVARAAADDRLRQALTPTRPSPDEVAARATS
jgi:hypothetical protein